jgi:hypothetical protein
MLKMGVWQDKGIFLIHIRDYFKQSKDSKSKHIPTEKGIALTINVWRAFISNFEHIMEDFLEMTKLDGSNTF